MAIWLIEQVNVSILLQDTELRSLVVLRRILFSWVVRCCVVLTFAFDSILTVDSCGAELAVWYAPSPFYLSGLCLMINGELKLQEAV